ncbi:hypothetical protein AVEN_198385-1 [Araneus ventricosus]|uniref:Uncharacterized protein n=1 Tax=Araneus ventricosus TaxID=182803 RepID=A0A4Y2FME1_ARAVE|nr:hypothetical protein AVEN_198385-1 [Araneus ventricosus]
MCGRECSIHITSTCGVVGHSTRTRGAQERGFNKCMGRHRRRPPRRAVLVAFTPDRCKLSDLPSANIAAAVGRRARISCYAFLYVVSA